MTNEPVPENVLSEWKNTYYATDAADRIQNTYDISCKAKDLIAVYGQTNVQSALREVVNGDRSSAARLARVCDILPEMISEAILKVKESQKLQEERLSSTTPDQRGRRAKKGGDRVKRSAGFSQTHLLILATVSDKGKRKNLFNRSLQEAWGSTQLQRELKKLGASPVKASAPGKAASPAIRPLQRAYAIELRAKKLVELLADLKKEVLMESIEKIKPADLATASKQFEIASQEIRKLADLLKGKSSLFSRIATKISK